MALLLLLPAVLLLASGCGRPEFDGELAYSLLVRQCEFGPRPPGSEAHDEMRDWLVAELTGRADEVSVQKFTARDTAGVSYEGANVIASFGVKERERVMFGAHWDTRAIAEKDPDPDSTGTPILGANDGASGVAVLLTLAEMMRQRAPDVGVDLVFFDLEDGGNGAGFEYFCLGSTYFALTMGDYAPRYVVVIDMVGDADLAISVEPNSMQNCPDIVELVWSAAERVGSSSFGLEQGTAMFDDHIPFIQAGVPAALVIDFEYPYWHTHEDTPDKCSAESLSEVGEVLAELIY